MKDVHPDKIRNVALAAHQSAGKTTLAESMMHRMGETSRMGRVEEGNTLSDYHADEIARKISISTTLLLGKHKGVKLNLLDTPGFTDFQGDTQSAIRVADVVGVLIHASSGLEIGTELVWDLAVEQKLPRFFFINHLDRENIEFDSIVNELETRFDSVIPVQLPVEPGEGFHQIIDLISMKLVVYNPDGGEKTRADIPDNLKDRAAEARQKLVERVAESDDALMEKFFENDGLTPEEFTQGLRTGLRLGSLFPLLCGAAAKEIGTSLLLDFLVEIAPSPVDMPPVQATLEGSDKTQELTCDPAAPTATLVFKTISDKHVGELSFFRVFSGTLKMGEEMRNTTRAQTEKIGQIFTVSSNNRKTVDEVCAGDMGALVKLKNTHTGDTLSSPKSNFILKGINFPQPVIQIAISPKNKGDEEKLSAALHNLAEEDPSFTFRYNPELAQLLVSGQGELHLTILIQRAKERFGVEVEEEKPRIPYRETIRKSSEAQGKYKKQTGGRGQYGDCWLRLEPKPRGSDIEFEDGIVGGVIPGKFIPAVEKGVRAACEEGVIAGYGVVDIKVTCFDGSYHTVDSSENAFRMAGSMGFKKVFKDATPMILEPIMTMEVRVPEEFMGDVMGDISSRRGKIMGMDRAGSFQIIRAKVPQAELYKYASVLRSLTGGRGMHKEAFSHYEEVPGDIQAKLTSDYEARRAEGSG